MEKIDDEKNHVEQTFEEIITLEINEHGKKSNIIEKCIKKAIYPQEFLCFISGLKNFEFVGWWNDWDLNQPLEQTANVNRPITVVRKI